MVQEAKQIVLVLMVDKVELVAHQDFELAVEAVMAESLAMVLAQGLDEQHELEEMAV